MNEMRKPIAPETVAAPPLVSGEHDAPGKPEPGRRRTEPQRTVRAERRAITRSRAPFRLRLFAVLLLFAVVPTIAVTLVWAATASRALSLVSARAAWESIAESGAQALSAARRAPLSAADQAALARHEGELRRSVELSRRADFVAGRSMRLVIVGAILVVGLVALGASRVAGHLSRQLSRPLDELVGWTGLIRTGRPIPGRPERRGAPEFEVLRTGMRIMAQELDSGRTRALEAERAEAFRESARRFAHELKNPLTPIRFAVERLRRLAPDELRDTVDVLAEESARLDTMARSFAQFGRLPDGPAAGIDVAELVARVARSTVPERLSLDVICEAALPLVIGYYEPLVRAVTNVLINAVDASGPEGRIAVRVTREHATDCECVQISITDSGCGVSPERLVHMFEPYVTTKPGGTGLGLAIARQTMEAHHGSISATSRVGVGTTMSLRLPVTEGELA